MNHNFKFSSIYTYKMKVEDDFLRLQLLFSGNALEKHQWNDDIDPFTKE